MRGLSSPPTTGEPVLEQINPTLDAKEERRQASLSACFCTPVPRPLKA
jgi:hypothetical protein